MKIKSGELIEQLQADTRQLILMAGYLRTGRMSDLSRQPGPGQWSVAQVLEHLNSYGKYYLPAIRKSLVESKAPPAEWFRAGWLGDYFTRIMKPREDAVIKNKMKAPKGHRPPFIADAAKAITTFLDQQHALLELLQWAGTRDISGARTPVSISPFIRLKTGDTFRFFIAHEQRHFVQIGNVLKMTRGQEIPVQRQQAGDKGQEIISAYR